MYKRILIAADGTPFSKKSIKSGIELAASLGAEVIALKVVPRYPMSYFEGGAYLANSEIANIEKSWSEAGIAIAEAVKAQAEASGVKAKAVTRSSDLVAESIIATATKHKCDLIVMASHGRKGIKRLLLGSETLHVLTHSAIPVLVIR